MRIASPIDKSRLQLHCICSCKLALCTIFWIRVLNSFADYHCIYNMHRLGRTSKPEHQLVLLLGLILGFITPSSIRKMEATLGAGLLETSGGGLHNATAPDECLPREAREEGAMITTPPTDKTKLLVHNGPTNTPLTPETLKHLQLLTNEDVNKMANKGYLKDWSVKSDLIQPTSSLLNKDFSVEKFTSFLNNSPNSSSSSTSSMPSWFNASGLTPWEPTTPQSESGLLSTFDGISEFGELSFGTEGGPEIEGSSISASSLQDPPRPFAPFEGSAGRSPPRDFDVDPSTSPGHSIGTPTTGSQLRGKKLGHGKFILPDRQESSTCVRGP
jgi:hypothetical protein